MQESRREHSGAAIVLYGQQVTIGCEAAGILTIMTRFGPVKRALAMLSAGLLMLTASGLFAGGYLAVDNTGQPYKWQGPITLHFDLGPLGKLSKTEADALTHAALAKWMDPELPGSGVQFVRGPDLTKDHGDGTEPNPAFDLFGPYDGITPVIYDQNGLLTDLLGENASASVVGFAGPVIPDDFAPAAIEEGIVVMNGKMISGTGPDLPMDQFMGAIVHELGHLLNLGHSQAALAFTNTGIDLGALPGLAGLGMGGDGPAFPADYRGLPTMFPAVMPGLDSLALDDMAWARSLYGNTSGVPQGSISGYVKNPDGSPFNGANMVAYSVDDYTSMITCVSGFTDALPTSAPTGFYKIPGLAPGTKWIVDVEPVADGFAGGSKVGPIDAQPLPALPEFVNEPGIESDSDQPSLSTTFVIPATGPAVHHTNANLQFNDPGLFDLVPEVDTGTDERAGQWVDVTPGRLTVIEGVIDPAEPDPQIYGIPGLLVLGQFHDFFRVKPPAGVELNLVAIDSDNSVLDAQVYHLHTTEDSYPASGTAAGFGFPSLSLYIDSSRIGADEAHRGTFAFGVGFAGSLVGGTEPFELTNYHLYLGFAVSDRDALALAGTDSGEVNPEGGPIRVRGRGFKNIGGAPEVTFSTPGLLVTSVDFVDHKNLDVTLAKGPGFVPGETTMQVMNRPESGGYGGRIVQKAVGSQSAVIGWELY